MRQNALLLITELPKQKKNARGRSLFFIYYFQNLRRKNDYCQKVRENHKSVENIRDVPYKRKFCERTDDRGKAEQNSV